MRARLAKVEAPKQPPATQSAKVEEKAAPKADEKPRFDFYKILPGTEEATPDKSAKDAPKGSTPTGKEAFFLQAGAFPLELCREEPRGRVGFEPLGFA